MTPTHAQTIAELDQANADLRETLNTSFSATTRAGMMILLSDGADDPDHVLHELLAAPADQRRETLRFIFRLAGAKTAELLMGPVFGESPP